MEDSGEERYAHISNKGDGDSEGTITAMTKK